VGRAAALSESHKLATEETALPVAIIFPIATNIGDAIEAVCVVTTIALVAWWMVRRRSR
jgi:hypothetical protein